ncbi:MAPEG family protein [Celeribacter sp.]|uniref:MAPEG family protein n=1 Tax=Celeribacter sp. TaxID=1890673 RepID=UPI003A9155BF
MFEITALYVGLAGIAYAALSLYVSLGRKARNQYKGDGGDTVMQTRIRQHGNFIEYTPITLLLIAMLESQGATAGVIHAAGIMLLATRAGHFFGFGHPTGYRMRCWSMVGCYALLLLLGVSVVVRALL